MSLGRRRLAAQAVLAMVMLLIAGADLVPFSYDADEQDDIPPVTVELRFLPQSPRAALDLGVHAVAHVPVFRSVALNVIAVAEARYTLPQEGKAPPQLFVPLLC